MEGNDAQKNKDEGQALAETMSNNIPLQRIVVSVKHQKRRSSKVLKQGWMLHYTERDTSVCKIQCFHFNIYFFLYMHVWALWLIGTGVGF